MSISASPTGVTLIAPYTGTADFFNLKRFIMQQYSKNPRKITDSQLEKLKSNIQELGDLSGIVHDLNTDEIISGN